MRCWECQKLIVEPEIIDGKIREPGQLRRMEKAPPVGGKAPVIDRVEYDVVCPHCRTQYKVKIVRMLEKAPAPKDTRTDEQKAEDELWKR